MIDIDGIPERVGGALYPKIKFPALSSDKGYTKLLINVGSNCSG
jgi:hypothetical protein